MTAPTVRRAPAAPDHATQRPAHQVRTGWHVRVADRWLLVDGAAHTRNTVYLTFADRSMVTVGRQSPLWCRTPAEHIAASTWGSK